MKATLGSAGQSVAAVLPGLASELRDLADRPDALKPAQAVGELAAQQREPNILRDTLCAACRAEAVLGADQDDAGRRD
jgi:hypothetical protein